MAHKQAVTDLTSITLSGRYSSNKLFCEDVQLSHKFHLASKKIRHQLIE